MEPTIPSCESTQLVCETCLKSYQRRDLLMRHRRRCRGPAKSGNRRKACDACVRAKVKCSHTQPTCSRCAKRGSSCIYSAPSAAQEWSHPEDAEEASSIRNQKLQLCPSAGCQSSIPELPTWNLELSPYALDAFELDTFDLNLAEFSNESPAPRPAPLMDKPYISPITHGNSPSIPPTQTSDDSSRSASHSPTSKTTLILAHTVSDYFSVLVKGSCLCPFLHLPKVKNVEPDLTSFPFTSMAICSSAAMSLSTDKQFFRRAIDASRHQLIGSFPSYECMQQWDAIHAILIYESLEIKDGIRNESEAWSLVVPIGSLEIDFLLKMTRSYIRPYLQIRSADIDAFSDFKSTPCSPTTTTWGRWRTTETTRRTVFIVNIVNFLKNYDSRTRKPSPYYEPLNDDLILNMPLPCSQTVWLAYEEESCRLAMTRHQPSVDSSSDDPDRHVAEGLLRETCLSTIFSKYSKERIQAAIGSHVGLGDSDELRRLVILCATEQYL